MVVLELSMDSPIAQIENIDTKEAYLLPVLRELRMHPEGMKL